MESSSFILPAQSLHTRTTSFIPRQVGTLSIKGCVIKFSTCSVDKYSLFGKRSRREREIWYDAKGGEIKVKRFGIKAPQTALSSSIIEEDGTSQDDYWPRRELVADILPARPQVVPDVISLHDGCFMLLEGETYACLFCIFLNTSGFHYGSRFAI